MPCELCDDTRWKAIDTNGVRRVERCDCGVLGGLMVGAGAVPADE